MLLTEEQAREKWCPEARVALRHHEPNSSQFWGTANYDEDEGRISFCIASDCMMWRWGEQVADGKDARHGYCGLAGAAFP